MKHIVNFRLSSQAMNALSLLEKKLHTSKTTVVEKALQFYAKKELAEQKLILNYAGILTEEEADSLLTTIELTKHNKDIETKL